MSTAQIEISITDDPYRTEPGPVLLLAGPGTGKTYQIAKRIQCLVNERGISPDNITVVTFTKEAAKSMHAKLGQKGKPEYVEPDKRPGRISTMHSLGHAIIEENPEPIGLKREQPIRVVESESLRSVLMTDAALRVGLTVSDAKTALKDRSCASVEDASTSAKIIDEYERILRACNAVDYDDQIGLACKILRSDPDVHKTWCQRAHQLLVDEYQDINKLQWEMIELLSRDNRDGLFVVGDDDQSIYQFRGGSPAYIRAFHEHFGPSASIVQMKVSRRCLKNILDCANAVIAANDIERLPKHEPEYLGDDKGEVRVHSCPSDDREAEVIATLIRREMEELSGDCRGNAFILVKNKNYQKKIEEALKRFKIKYDARAPDEESTRRLAAIKAWIEDTNNLNTRQAMQLVLDASVLPGPKTKGKKQERRIAGVKEVAGLWEDVIGGETTLSEALVARAAASDVLGELKQKLEAIRSTSEDDLPEFVKDIVAYVRPWASMEAFFRDTVIARQGGQPQDSVFQVRILTMQSSKGLEADSVFVVGFEEGHMPSATEPKAVAEEARLVFVAMTRAKRKLHLFHSRTREGSVTFKADSHALKKSSFLEILPKGQFQEHYYKPKTS